MNHPIIIHIPLVSADWLYKNFDAKNLIILNATIQKITSTSDDNSLSGQIPNSRFFDLKHKFSDTSATFPNTIPSAKQFESEAQSLGINSDSIIVIYDEKGIYSSPRAWWLFKTMGFHNVAVLDGGLPEWKSKEYPVSKSQLNIFTKGNFKANYNSELIHFFEDMKKVVEEHQDCIVDARSAERFNGAVTEPRAGLRSGHIPNSFNLPYADLLDGNTMKPLPELKLFFKGFRNKKLVFTCGSGITACILALAADLCGYRNASVYDGSWTEWGALTKG